MGKEKNTKKTRNVGEHPQLDEKHLQKKKLKLTS